MPGLEGRGLRWISRGMLRGPRKARAPQHEGAELLVGVTSPHVGEDGKSKA